MGDITLDVVPLKLQQKSTPGLGMTYPESVELFRRMQAQDSRVVFYTIRTIGDEVWNMVDGKKTIGEIAAACAIEFGVMVDEELFLPIFEGLKNHNLITFSGD